jgi:hypothetical protein
MIVQAPPFVDQQDGRSRCLRRQSHGAGDLASIGGLDGDRFQPSGGGPGQQRVGQNGGQRQAGGKALDHAAAAYHVHIRFPPYVEMALRQ